MRTKKRVIGLTEKVKIVGPKGKTKVLMARVDTGATISSVDADLAAELSLGPVIRTMRIKQAQGSSSRAIIPARIIIAKKSIKGEFTIADRKHMKYAVLIGQNLMKGFLIDPSK